MHWRVQSFLYVQGALRDKLEILSLRLDTRRQSLPLCLLWQSWLLLRKTKKSLAMKWIPESHMLPCIWVNSKQIFLTLQIDLCVYSNRGRLILNFLVARKCIFTFNLFTQTYSDVLKLYNGHQANSKWLDYNHPCSKHQSMATNNIQNTFQPIKITSNAMYQFLVETFLMFMQAACHSNFHPHVPHVLTLIYMLLSQII